MNKFFFIKLFLVSGGTICGLFASRADKIFWLTELSILTLLSFFLKEILTNEIEKIAFQLSIRVVCSYVLTLGNTLFFIYFIEYWKELIGFMIGTTLMVWMDTFEKFYVNRAVISWPSKTIIFIKMGSLMMFNCFNMFYLKENYYLLAASSVTTFILSLLMIGVIYVNIKSILGVELDNSIEMLKIIFWLDITVLNILNLMSIGHSVRDETGKTGWIIGITLYLTTNVLFYLLGRYEARKVVPIRPIIPRLKDITIVMQPDLDIKIGEKLS